MAMRLRPGTPELEGPLSDDTEATLGAAYAYLQIWTGLIAFTLPIVLVLGNLVLGGTTPGSISAYYYTEMRAWFIGAQFVLGVFFLSYNYRPLDRYTWDNRMSNVACVAMLVVALVPTKQVGPTTVGSVLHLVAAGTVFVLLAWFAFFRFTMSKEGAELTDRKRRRNVVFTVCGAAIALSMVVLLAIWVTVGVDHDWRPLLVFESIAIFAFGVSWLVKGGFLGILADPPSPS